MTPVDLAVVGAGVLGLACAREAQRRDPRARVVVLEREAEVAAHQTSHNSGVVHSGIYYAPGSLKARLCVEGRRRLEDYCAGRGIPYRRCGKLIVAHGPVELRRLDELERRAAANGVAVRRLDPAGIREVEPACAGDAALHVLDTGVTDFAAVARAFADDVRAGDGDVRLGVGVRRIEAARPPATSGGDVGRAPWTPVGDVARSPWAPVGDAARLHLDDDSVVEARRVVTCAGAWSDRLATASGAPASPRILPFRGAYADVRPERAHLVRALIYPVPDPALPFLGVHLTRGVHGDVHVGPTALLAGARDAYALTRVRLRDVADTLTWRGTWPMLAAWRTAALEELRTSTSRRRLAAAAARHVPELRAQDLAPGTAGVRAQAVDHRGKLLDDFALQRTGDVLHVRNAPSPAATASLALAGAILDALE